MGENNSDENVALEGMNVETKEPQKGIFLSRIKFLIIVVIVIILFILVIVFAVLFVRSRSRGDEVGGKSGTREATPSSNPVPTTPGTEAWWNVRLPSDVIPVDYNVFLDINLEKLRFDGNVEIFVNVTQSTNLILVHSKKMNVTSVAVKKSVKEADLPIKNHFWFKKNQFYVIQLESILESGQYVVSMSYNAFLATELVGLYKGDYKRPNGDTVLYVASQLQPTDARKVFPCFDEPGLKATFSITIGHRPDFISISNMPIYKTQVKNGKKYDYFSKTPKMSTYLLAFAVCDFGNRTVVTEDNVKMTFYATPHQISQMTYAPHVASKVLTYYTKYYGIKYPLPKADMIALPDFSFGAMENWGLIMYREKGLLWTQDSSSETNKEYTGSIISHELAHQWFGNIVTMKWWDDLWLNEGFASYVWYQGLASVEQTWKLSDQFVVKALTRALSLDGLASSHPIKIPVNHPDQIGEIFDSISYSKGASILRMLEDFLGTDTFVSGIKRYLKKHEYGSAETDDLWKALKDESCSRGRCVDVKDVMDTWTLQMGYPVITLKRKDATHFTASQKRFLFDKKANVSNSKFKSPFNYLWVVPFTYVTSKEPNRKIGKKVEKDGKAVTISWDGSGWIKGNYEHKGYYLVNYEDSNWDALATQLRQNHLVFGDSDRAGLIQDVFNLARAGLVNYTKALSLTSYLKNETDYVPWVALLQSVGYMENILSQTRPAYKNLQKYLAYLTKTKYEELGFADTGDHLAKLTRDVLLEINCKAGTASCVNNATARYEAWMKNPVLNPIPPNFRSLVYYYGIANGGVEEWNFAFSQFQKVKEANAKNALLDGMAASREPWILERYLEYALDPSKIKSQDTTRVITNVATHNPMGKQLAWNFVISKWDVIMDRFGSSVFHLGNIILSLTSGFSTEYELSKVTEFSANNPNIGTGMRALAQGIERVKGNIDWVKENEKDVEDWLAKFAKDHKL